MKSIAGSLAREKRGPELYLGDDGQAITLGELWAALLRINNALTAAAMMLAGLESYLPCGEGMEEKSLLLNLALEYASRSAEYILPCRGLNGRALHEFEEMK